MAYGRNDVAAGWAAADNRSVANHFLDAPVCLVLSIAWARCA
jgi:hypothetical protein